MTITIDDLNIKPSLIETGAEGHDTMTAMWEINVTLSPSLEFTITDYSNPIEENNSGVVIKKPDKDYVLHRIKQQLQRGDVATNTFFNKLGLTCEDIDRHLFEEVSKDD